MNTSRLKSKLSYDEITKQLDELSKLEAEHLTDTEYDDEGIFKSKSYRSEGWVNLEDYSLR